jgi:hypothetical protein
VELSSLLTFGVSIEQGKFTARIPVRASGHIEIPLDALVMVLSSMLGVKLSAFHKLSSPLLTA